jgi:hypothetical protein
LRHGPLSQAIIGLIEQICVFVHFKSSEAAQCVFSEFARQKQKLPKPAVKDVSRSYRYSKQFNNFWRISLPDRGRRPAVVSFPRDVDEVELHILVIDFI